MKLNKWTLGLAALGAVSLASAVRADETKLSAVQTALSNTTISGYVDVAAQYNMGDPGGPRWDRAMPINQPLGLNPSKVDNFSLNNVTVSLDKPLDESPWAAGYHIDINAGTDAITPLNSASTSVSSSGAFYNSQTESWQHVNVRSSASTSIMAVGIRQAYVTMRTPVGNGIDWKFGLFDGVTGYESNTGYANPNYTRSYGYLVNPASELGIIGSYKIVNGVTVQLGMANRGSNFAGSLFGYSGYGQSSVGLSSHDYIATVALTAPDSWGFLKGSTLSAGTVQGFDNGAVNNYNVSATIATPITGLKVGLSYDAVQTLVQQNPGNPVYQGPDLSWDANIYGVYATYQATDKLSFNVRGEYVDLSGTAPYGYLPNVMEATATVEYDLWANVVSRLEFRWDHVEHGQAYNGAGVNSWSDAPADENAFMIALNVVYKF